MSLPDPIMFDDVIEALEDVEDAAQSTAAASGQLLNRVRDSSRQRRSGESWRAIITSEPAPRLVERISALMARWGAAGSRLRRAQAAALREEGMTADQIAQLFGVSRQRVSALLRPVGSDASSSSAARTPPDGHRVRTGPASRPEPG
jgi:hypothetical protein